MRKMRILIIAILVVIILVGGALALNLFAFGKVKDVSSIGVQNLSVTNEKIFFLQFL